jgi:Flp pilus assembly protein TadD
VEASLRHLERAAALQPDAGSIQATLARAYQRSGAREEARRIAGLARGLRNEVILDDRVMASVNEEAVSLVGLQRRAAEAESRGDLVRAEVLLRRAVEIRPEDADLHYNLANHLSRNGRSDEAKSSFRRALALEPEHVSALVNLGILLGIRGERAEAKQLLERALALEPEHPGALSSLAKVEAFNGEADSALRLFERSLSADPSQPETLYALAQVLLHLGRVREAIQSFSRAVDLAPDRADIHFDLAVACAQIGDYRSAWRHVLQAREIGFVPPEDFIAALEVRMSDPSKQSNKSN